MHASVAAVVAVLWLSANATAAADSPKPVTHKVAIEATSFLPTAITVNAGDTIVWTNKDPFPHTVTSKAGGFDSGLMMPDKSWRYRPTKKGEFAYLCAYHPTMTATLRVK